MFSGFFGKGDKKAKPAGKRTENSSGLEVTEGDPDTVWGLWDSALAEQDSRFSAEGAAKLSGSPSEAAVPLPVLDIDIDNAPTTPMALDATWTPEQRKEAALKVVERHHQRVANTIRTLWGYKECSVYINQLIMNGADDTGHARVGFNQHAAESMLMLADLHDQLYGVSDPGRDFAETTRGTGWGKLR